MCKLGIYTVRTWRNVSGHNPRISSHPKCVNWVFTHIRLGGMCPDTIPQFPASKNVWIGYLNSSDSGECVWTQSHNFQPVKMCELGICTVLTWSNLSGPNPTISSEQKCVNWVFTQFGLGMCPDTIQEFLAIQNVWIRCLHSSDSEECVWTQSQNF